MIGGLRAWWASRPRWRERTLDSATADALAKLRGMKAEGEALRAELDKDLALLDREIARLEGRPC